MLKGFRSHFRHNVVAYLALFFALGGTAIAAKPLLTGADVQDGSLTGADVSDQSTLKGVDIDESDLGKVPAAASADNSDTLDGYDSSEFFNAAQADCSFTSTVFAEDTSAPQPREVCTVGDLAVHFSCWRVETGHANMILQVRNDDPDFDDRAAVWGSGGFQLVAGSGQRTTVASAFAEPNDTASERTLFGAIAPRTTGVGWGGFALLAVRALEDHAECSLIVRV